MQSAERPNALNMALAYRSASAELAAFEDAAAPTPSPRPDPLPADFSSTECVPPSS